MKSIALRFLLAGAFSLLLSAAATPTKAQLAYLYGVYLGAQMRDQGVTPDFDAADLKRGLSEGEQGVRLEQTEREELVDYLQTAMHRRTAIAELSRSQAGHFFGVLLGQQLHLIGVTDGIDPGAVERGVRSGMRGKQLTADETKDITSYARASVQAMQTKNAKIAADFLANNARQPGIKSTASGLQYKVLTSGDPKGISIRLSDHVLVNYRVTFPNGTVFDSSNRGGPADYTVGTLVKGWQEALLRMKPGDRWELYLPPALAYGSQPRPRIPPNSVLIYDVELVGIEPRPPANGSANAAKTGVNAPSQAPAP